MQLSDLIFSRLRIGGYKLTKGRKSIIGFFAKSKSPVSALELLSFLHAENLPVNKTTIYREIKFLKRHNIIREIQFSERNKRYELTIDDHHHHIVCKNCKQVEEVASQELESKLSLIEKEIISQNNFKDIKHSLEFFGLCASCNK